MRALQDTNFNMVRGDTLSFAFEVEVRGDEQELDDIRFSCKKNYRDSNYIFQKSLNDGISKARDGKYRVRVAPEDTAEVEPGEYLYDLEIRENGDVFTILRGKLKIVNDVTRGE